MPVELLKHLNAETPFCTKLAALRRYPEIAGSLIEYTLKDMVRAGKLTGIEIAFLGGLTRAMALKPALSAVAA